MELLFLVLLELRPIVPVDGEFWKAVWGELPIICAYLPPVFFWLSLYLILI